MRNVGLAVLFFSLSLSVGATEWHSTEASKLTFAVAFEGAATRGEFKEFDVDLDIDAARPESGRLRVTVNLKAADMGDPDMNGVLLGPAWLDVEQFTQSVFVSDVIAEQAPGKFVATGALDLKGKVRPVAVPFSWTSSGKKATLQGSLVLQRTDFDVGSGEWSTDEAIGIDVTLDFAVQLVREE